MKHIITPSLAANFRSALNRNDIRPDLVKEAEVSTNGIPSGSTYQLGCRFHALLQRIADHGPLSREEKLLLPWLNATRSVLREAGVEFITPEVSLSSRHGIPAGRCDLLLRGGFSRKGIGEVKVVDQLPEEPRAADLLQCMGYQTLLTANRRGVRSYSWGCLIYVGIRQRMVRVFSYRHHNIARDTAMELLAA